MITFAEFQKNYTNCRLLNRGGQKQVFSARHPSYGDVVIKLYFKADIRAEREVTIGSKTIILEVPCVYETQTLLYEGTPTLCVVERKIEGMSLREKLQKEQKLSVSQSIYLLEKGLIFIQKLEEKQIIHRDIKPENIIWGDDGKIYFIDFGIARFLNLSSITATQANIGPHTPGYAAPEQFNNLKRYITSRADIFSLGVVVYECLSGRNPFCTSNNPNEILQNVLHLYPEPLHILGEENQELSSFILSMIQKQPSQRPRNATQALHWLQTIKTEIKI